jgi:hypothetical protein
MPKDEDDARYSRLLTRERLRWHLDGLLFALKALICLAMLAELVLLAYVLRALIRATL